LRAVFSCYGRTQFGQEIEFGGGSGGGGLEFGLPGWNFRSNIPARRDRLYAVCGLRLDLFIGINRMTADKARRRGNRVQLRAEAGPARCCQAAGSSLAELRSIRKR
jgi:hypothetical protein